MRSRRRKCSDMRESYNGADFQTALTSKRRRLPNGADFQTTLSDAKRRLGVRAVWEFAPFGSQRRLGVRAVKEFVLTTTNQMCVAEWAAGCQVARPSCSSPSSHSSR